MTKKVKRRKGKWQNAKRKKHQAKEVKRHKAKIRKGKNDKKVNKVIFKHLVLATLGVTACNTWCHCLQHLQPVENTE